MKTSAVPIIIWIATFLMFSVLILGTAPELPPSIATHFDAAGRPNGWSSATGYTVTFMLTALLAPGFVLGICYSIRFFPASMLNVPNADYWRSPDRYPQVCALLFNHAFWFASLMTLWLGSLHYYIIEANGIAPTRLDNGAIALASGVFLGGLLVWILFLLRPFLKAGPALPAGQNTPDPEGRLPSRP